MHLDLGSERLQLPSTPPVWRGVLSPVLYRSQKNTCVQMLRGITAVMLVCQLGSAMGLRLRNENTISSGHVEDAKDSEIR